MEFHLEALHKEINCQKTKLPVFYIRPFQLKLYTSSQFGIKIKIMKIEYTNYGILGQTQSTNSLSQLENRKLQIHS